MHSVVRRSQRSYDLVEGGGGWRVEWNGGELRGRWLLVVICVRRRLRVILLAQLRSIECGGGGGGGGGGSGRRRRRQSRSRSREKALRGHGSSLMITDHSRQTVGGRVEWRYM
jgi:hypothetical protein